MIQRKTNNKRPSRRKQSDTVDGNTSEMTPQLSVSDFNARWAGSGLIKKYETDRVFRSIFEGRCCTCLRGPLGMNASKLSQQCGLVARRQFPDPDIGYVLDKDRAVGCKIPTPEILTNEALL